MPYLLPDVRITGNHDFAYGENLILRDIDNFPTPVLSSNLSYSGANPDDLLPSTFVQVRLRQDRPLRSRHLVIEKRDLYYPSYAFTGDTSFMPSPSAVPISSGVEAFQIMLDYARAQGAACKYVDTGAPSPCP